ncbi:hypothetical protein CR513_48582, partial [Mucuna pruriens]
MDKKYEGHDIKKKFNEFLKRSVQFVFSVCVFCFFAWYSSGFSIVPQSFNAFFSTWLFSMFTRTLERKYMFLICNVILALLATSPFDIEFQASTIAENPPLMVEEHKRQEEYSEQVSEAEDGTIMLFTEEGGTGSSGVTEAQDYEQVADTTTETKEELENTDEVNRKFEEFIRKMKEKMRIEAQR